MARKKSTKKTVRVHEMIDTQTESLLPMAPVTTNRLGTKKHIGIALIVIGILAVLAVNKSLFLAAIVDGRPVFRWELTNVLISRFGKQTLEGVISERLIANAAQKEGISVSQSELDTKTKQLVSSLGDGMTIDQLLQYQGMTRADFDSQLKLQLTVEKLLGKDIVVTDSEVTNYIATASATLTATDEAGLRTEAADAILNERITQKLQPWFTELKAKSTIVRFL